jgi:hypothetical protein
MLFLTPVWGEAYVRLYLDVVIPAQLAPQNLPVFASQVETKYVIFTTAADMETIRSAPVFALLNAAVEVVFEFVDPEIKVAHGRMSDCFRRGIEMANNAGVAVVFLTPDIVFANGSFASLKRLSEQGYDVIFIPAIRTLKQGVSVGLLSQFKTGPAIQICPHDLMRTALDNLHPLADLSWWDEGETDLLPANLYWRVNSEGILGRCFHLHPLYVRPQRRNVRFFGTVDDDYCSAACPDRSRDYVVTDSDEFLAIELSDPSHFVRTGLRKGSIDDVVAWAELAANSRHRSLFDHVMRMHTGIHNVELWAQAAAEADDVATLTARRLELSTWRLGGKPSLFVRRTIRRARDKRLQLANRSDGLIASNIPSRILDYVERWPVWLLDSYEGAIRLIRKTRKLVSGAEEHPRFYTSRSLSLHQVRRELVNLAGPISDALVVTDGNLDSLMEATFKSGNISSRSAILVTQNGEDLYVVRQTSKFVASESCDLVLLELCDRNRITNKLAAAHYVLRPNGRLVILMNRFAPAQPLLGVADLGRASVEEMLRPSYCVLEHREQGGVGSALKLTFSSWFATKRRHRPILFRILELTALWIPFYVLLGSMLNALALFLDMFDRNRIGAISSVTLARKEPDVAI